MSHYEVKYHHLCNQLLSEPCYGGGGGKCKILKFQNVKCHHFKNAAVKILMSKFKCHCLFSFFFLYHYVPVRQANWCNMTFTVGNLLPSQCQCHSSQNPNVKVRISKPMLNIQISNFDVNVKISNSPMSKFGLSGPSLNKVEQEIVALVDKQVCVLS